MPFCLLALCLCHPLSLPKEFCASSNGRGRCERPVAVGRGSGSCGLRKGEFSSARSKMELRPSRMPLLVAAALLLLAGPAASWGARKRATSVLFEKFDAREAVVDPCYEDSGGGGGGSGGKKTQGGLQI